MTWQGIDVTPDFAEPGHYLRYYGLNIGNPVIDYANQLRFVRLLDREGPLVYPYKFNATNSNGIAVDSLNGIVNYSDLDPANTHIYQLFLGVNPGADVLLSHPFDTRLLKWDQNVQNVSEDTTAVISSEMSPYRAPVFEIWVAPGKRYPGLDVRNRLQEIVAGGTAGRYSTWNTSGPGNLMPMIIWVGARFRYMLVDAKGESAIFNALSTWQIPSRPVTFGGTLREVVR